MARLLSYSTVLTRHESMAEQRDQRERDIRYGVRIGDGVAIEAATGAATRGGADGGRKKESESRRVVAERAEGHFDRSLKYVSRNRSGP